MKGVALGIAVLAQLSFFGCGKAGQLPASYCATVAVHDPDEKHAEQKLIGILNRFVHSNKFRLNGSAQGGTYEYTNRSGDVALDVTFGMGDFGSVVTLFYHGAVGDKTRRDLDKFLMWQVSPVFPVRKCSDIPGFRNPEMYDTH